MSHWANDYVGLDPSGPRPCWALVRKVWAERTGVLFPAYDDGDAASAIGAEEVKFVEVQPGEERPLDAVVMSRWGEPHIGVVIQRGLVLHQYRDALSKIEPLNSLGACRIMRMEILA